MFCSAGSLGIHNCRAISRSIPPWSIIMRYPVVTGDSHVSSKCTILILGRVSLGSRSTTHHILLIARSEPRIQEEVQITRSTLRILILRQMLEQTEERILLSL